MAALSFGQMPRQEVDWILRVDRGKLYPRFILHSRPTLTSGPTRLHRRKKKKAGLVVYCRLV